MKVAHLLCEIFAQRNVQSFWFNTKFKMTVVTSNDAVSTNDIKLQ